METSEPLFFEPVFLDAVWGGYKIAAMKNTGANLRIGQSWELYAHPHRSSVVASGPLAGTSLSALCAAQHAGILGTALAGSAFPLHVAMLDTADMLSIQVHPGDSYARLHYGSSGKSEAWFIVNCSDNSFVYAGTELDSADAVLSHAAAGTLEEHLRKIPVRKGDLIVIPAGMIHALGKDITAVEVAQNADITFRVYDYGRGRGLHLQAAAAVIDTSLRALIPQGIATVSENCRKAWKYACEHFSIEIYEISGCHSEYSDPERFAFFCCTDGSGMLSCNGRAYTIESGRSFLLPAATGQYTLDGKMTLLRACKPDKQTISQSVSQSVSQYLQLCQNNVCG